MGVSNKQSWPDENKEKKYILIVCFDFFFKDRIFFFNCKISVLLFMWIDLKIALYGKKAEREVWQKILS